MKYLLDNYSDESRLEKKTIREGFGVGVVKVAEKNEMVYVLNADLPGSLKLHEYISKFPDRYVQTGVAEQNMAGIATGLESLGKVPFITSFAAFNPGLNFSQIRLAALGNQNIKVIGSHYGLNVGKDGASAQMNADVAMMKAIPNMVVISPADYNQAIQATIAIAEYSGPCYMRVTRETFPVFINSKANFEIGKAQILEQGEQVTVIASGSVVYETLNAVQELKKQNISCEVINIHTIKPLDSETIIESAKKTKRVIVIEEHNIWGGLGESVARVLSQTYPVKMNFVGVTDTFGESGSHRDLWKKYGLDSQSIANEIMAML